MAEDVLKENVSIFLPVPYFAQTFTINLSHAVVKTSTFSGRTLTERVCRFLAAGGIVLPQYWTIF